MSLSISTKSERNHPAGGRQGPAWGPACASLRHDEVWEQLEGGRPQVGSTLPQHFATTGGRLEYKCLALTVNKPFVILIMLMNQSTLGISIYLKPIVDVLSVAVCHRGSMNLLI